MWREFWKEVNQSEVGKGPYDWSIIAAGHFLIGTALISTGLFVPWFIILAYLVGKEWYDWKYRGGSVLDGIIDTAFVALGVFQAPILALLLIAIGITFFDRLIRS